MYMNIFGATRKQEEYERTDLKCIFKDIYKSM